MRRSREEVMRTHARIVERAAVLFRERGIDGIGLADLMQQAGLTHGGFYRHFPSKEELVAAACAHALAESARRMRRRAAKDPDDPLAAVIDGFLSADHVADPGHGCAIAALGSDIFRCSAETREAFTEGVAELVAVMTELQKKGNLSARRERALTTLASMLGAVIIARGVSDPELRQSLLEAMRRRLLRRVRRARARVKSHAR
jgi:TetR/AcrR family transcriptional regulator, transcriptional repressor for nem operon